jgi:hypothetical protein
MQKEEARPDEMREGTRLLSSNNLGDGRIPREKRV